MGPLGHIFSARGYQFKHPGLKINHEPVTKPKMHSQSPVPGSQTSFRPHGGLTEQSDTHSLSTKVNPRSQVQSRLRSSQYECIPHAIISQVASHWPFSNSNPGRQTQRFCISSQISFSPQFILAHVGEHCPSRIKYPELETLLWTVISANY